MRGKLLLGLTAAGAAAAVALFGGLLAGTGPQAAARAPEAGLAGLAELLEGFSAGSTAATVRRLERRVRRSPHDADGLTLLGLAYQQRARETADPAFYSLSARALRQALAAGGERSLPRSGLAALAVARHRFAGALAPARTAIRLDAENGAAWAALGDALVGLGRYRQGFRALDRAAELSPSAATYARIGFARELIGRPQDAEEAIQLALGLDRAVPEHEAWALVQLGNVRFNVGRLTAAERAYRSALVALPGYVHAQAGLARVEAARGRYGRAAALLRRAVEVLPTAQNAILLGDVLRASGRDREARAAYDLVRAIERLLAANGVRTELQTALFDLDHGRRLRDALARARAAYAAAPSIFAADAVAWGLFRTGRCGQALPYSRRALRLGTQDALKLFHRGMIERCLGHERAGHRFLRRALDLNPHFSLLWAPVAREALA